MLKLTSADRHPNIKNRKKYAYQQKEKIEIIFVLPMQSFCRKSATKCVSSFKMEAAIPPSVPTTAAAIIKKLVFGNFFVCAND